MFLNWILVWKAWRNWVQTSDFCYFQINPISKSPSVIVIQQNMRVTRQIVLPLLTKALYEFGCFKGILQKAKLALLIFYWVALTRFCMMVTQAAFISTAADSLYLGTNLGHQSGLDFANPQNRGYIYHYRTCAIYNLLFAFFQPPLWKQFIK